MSVAQDTLRNRVTDFLKGLQDEITSTLSALDGTAFHEDSWERADGGGGRTRVIADGTIFEKAGVNFSAVHGKAPAYLKKEHPSAETFYATGVSLVLHPHSPKVPTVHANFRYFELSDGTAWFGGGMDLTPYYLVEEDAIAFHKTIKQTCDKHDANYYPRFKKWCDEYFFIKHRGETRGIGGIFYDNLGSSEKELERLFDFQQDIARTFLPAYVPIVESHKKESYTEKEKQWQLLRRGRYVEFNLVYDKGTVFGLETGGRIESILMSLPTLARWEYDHHPEIGSPEAALHNVLVHPKDWASL
ncbi:MAG TPA: oxygen-dependent coproporphyrinogen oxidase [Candidatus Kapabacteria bacterium]|nr:oxygen-dependent coproporphyrinogen oxidase [Candidatus Kapabacteria bacterium]